MLLASAGAHRLSGALLNDIGPELEAQGLVTDQKPMSGVQSGWPTWLHAARCLVRQQSPCISRFHAGGLARPCENGCARSTPRGGSISIMTCTSPIRYRLPGGEAGFDGWAALEALKSVPSFAAAWRIVGSVERQQCPQDRCADAVDGMRDGATSRPCADFDRAGIRRRH